MASGQSSGPTSHSEMDPTDLRRNDHYNTGRRIQYGDSIGIELCMILVIRIDVVEDLLVCVI